MTLILCVDYYEAKFLVSEDLASPLTQVGYIVVHPKMRFSSKSGERFPTNFAQHLVQEVDLFCSSEDFSLVVCASSEVLKELLSYLSDEARTKITGVISKNLCRSSQNSIASLLLRANETA